MGEFEPLHNIKSYKIIASFNCIICVCFVLLIIYSYTEPELNWNWIKPTTQLKRPKIYAALDSWGDVTELQEHQEIAPKLILLYTPWYGNPLWFSPGQSKDGNFYTLESDRFSCPRQCQFTHNKSFIRTADMVVLSIVDLVQRRPWIPLDRPMRQIWTGFICESPANFRIKKALRGIDDLFNWTTSYRRDSDVYWPSGHFYKLKEPLRSNSKALGLPTTADLKSKKLVSWLVSNCNTLGRREDIVKVMQSYITVDVYGKCGPFKCPKNGDCRHYLGSKYKFYLSFENSLCVDYITEKFYDAFDDGMVPVTFGLANYNLVAPPHSFINILDFPTIKNLTDYLLFLDKNDEAYLKYFEWKRQFIVLNDPTSSGLCHLCVKLWNHHNQHQPTKIYPSFLKWWLTNPRPSVNHTSPIVEYSDGICSNPAPFY